MNKPIIYFAGKIGKRDWRFEIFGDDRIGGLNFSCERERRYLFDESYTVSKGDFLYGGPFFVSCDHGCFHMGESHGVASQEGCGVADSDGRIEETRRKIWRVNRARVRRADIVFAYINEIDCYGTLVEIGMAQAQGKAAIIGFGDNVPADVYDDLWMTRQAAKAVFRGTPQRVWKKFARFCDGDIGTLPKPRRVERNLGGVES